MTEERDPQVSGRYRELGAEEPPPALDQKILAASRRTVRAAPHGAGIDPWAPGRRWYVSLAATAVFVLAVAVGVQIERERPDDVAAPTLQRAPQEQKAPSHAPEPQPPVVAEAPQSAPASPAPEPMREGTEGDAASAAEGARAEARPQFRALAKAVSPEDELERIAALRRDGRHEEADRALAEFRRRYPEFRISEEMLKKVEK